MLLFKTKDYVVNCLGEPVEWGFGFVYHTVRESFLMCGKYTVVFGEWRW